METLNRNRNDSLNGKLNGNLDENLHGNLNGNLWGKLDGNLNEPNLGPNSDQTWIKRVSLGVPGGFPWGSLGGPWGSLEGSVGDQTGAQLWSGTGPAPGTQKVPKVCNCSQKQLRAYFGGSGRYQIFGPPRGLSKTPY